MSDSAYHLAYYLSRRDELLKRAVDWQKKHPERRALTCRSWAERNREKRNAYNSVRRALKSGKLKRPARCQNCGKRGPVEAHHKNYARRLDVDWLCSGCHGAQRRGKSRRAS